MALHNKKRSPFDKVIKTAKELLRQELAPLQDVAAKQEKIIAQNEKNTEFLRQIWAKLDDENTRTGG